MKGVKYKERVPHASLQDHVNCFWIMEREYTPEHPAEDVTPDAFIELIVITTMSFFYKSHLTAATRLAADSIHGLESDTMNKVKIISVLVRDYDAAIEFYTGKLGFELIEDKQFGDNRWVTIALPENRDLTLALELATTAEDKALVGKQAGSHAFLAIDTSDCLGDYTQMKRLGVTFLGEPQSGPWGTGVQLQDLYGNKLFLSQEPS
jgi:catechol 2,3-dioxygenase-like lactoylglutathione lyase family enzyme